MYVNREKNAMNGNVSSAPTADRIKEFVELLQQRGITREAFSRAIESPEVCDQVAKVMRIVQVPAVDISGPLNKNAIKRVVNYLFDRAIVHAKKYDDVPWYSRASGYNPRDLYEEANFRKLLLNMEPQYLTILVKRNGLLDGVQVPAGILAERYGVSGSDIATMLGRANKHMKVRQAEVFPFISKQKFPYEYLYREAHATRKDLEIRAWFNDPKYIDVRDRILAAGIETVGELLALPRRQAATLLLGDLLYLPPEHFPL